jgi:hypothetical protein
MPFAVQIGEEGYSELRSYTGSLCVLCCQAIGRTSLFPSEERRESYCDFYG